MDDETQPPVDPPEMEHEPGPITGPDLVPASPAPPPRARLRRIDVITLIAITLVTGIVHFARLANPDRPLPLTDEQCKKFPRLTDVCHEMIPLDEWHYIPDARDVLLYGSESDRRVPPDDGAFVVHPPAGKWFIALGIRIFGDSGFGWRFFGALFGTLAVAVLYLLAWRLWRSTLLAGIAALLLGVEGLWFVMSRVAMLDIYAAFFVLVAVWLLVEDRARASYESKGSRRWRLGAGIMFGLALASKWSAIPFFMAAVALALSYEFRYARPQPWIRKALIAVLNWLIRMSSKIAVAVRSMVRRSRREPKGTVRQISTAGLQGSRGVALAGALVLVPVLVYTATYLPWFFDAHRYDPPRCEGKMKTTWYSEKGVSRLATGWLSDTGRFGQWVCYQREMGDFHRHLDKFEAADETSSGAPSPKGSSAASSSSTAKVKPAHPYFGNGYAWPWMGRPVAHYYEEFGEDSQEKIKHVVGLPNPAIWWAGFLAIPFLLWRALKKRDRVASMIIAFIAVGWLPFLYADMIDRPAFLFYATPMIPFLVLGIVHAIARALVRFPDGAPVMVATYVAIAVIAFVYFYPVLAAYPIARGGLFGWTKHMWFNTPHVKIFGRFLIPGDCTAVDAIKNFCWI